MSTIASPASRFRELRERAGLSRDEVANRMGVSSSCIWDIETSDSELFACYSPVEIERFCRALNIRPVELLDLKGVESPIAAPELVKLINEQCHRRGVSLEQFENIVGWRLTGIMEPPSRLLEDITIDGLLWLCRELGVDWRRVILSM